MVIAFTLQLMLFMGVQIIVSTLQNLHHKFGKKTDGEVVIISMF